MMNNLQSFSYESNEVRTIMIDGEPWFVLKDVCQVLGIVNHKNIAARLDEDEKGVDLLEILVNFLVSFVASVAGDYVSKWLERHGKGK